jgi:hypothetical protein
MLRARAGDAALRIALGRGNGAVATELFRKTCDATNVTLVVHARRLLLFAGLGDDAYRVLAERIAAPGHSPVAASLWALTSLERGDGRVEPWLFRADPEAKATRAAAKAVLALLDKRGRRARVRWLGWRLPRSLRESEEVRAALAEAKKTKPRPRTRAVQRATAVGWVVLGVVMFGAFVATVNTPDFKASALTPMIGPAVFVFFRYLRKRS